MKKLMIAAAAAAMIGGAYADTAYTLQVSVKTTVGKSGKLSWTDTYNLGADSTGMKFWYEDSTVDALKKADTNGYFTTKTKRGKSFPTLSNKAKKDTNWLLNTLKIAELSTNYTEKSDGTYCETIKIKCSSNGCYRVAGTRKFKGVVYGDACCDSLSNTNDEYTVTLDASLMQFFGGMKLSAAKKAELYGEIEIKDAESFPDTDEGLYIAGQGSKGEVIYDYDDTDDKFQTDDNGIKSISGNVVGTLEAPECEYCCAADEPAVAFVCDGDAKPDLTTAAYGTFSLKYNASETKKSLK